MTGIEFTTRIVRRTASKYRGKISITDAITDVMVKEMNLLTNNLKRTYLSGPTGARTISPRSRKLIESTYYKVGKVPGKSVLGSLIVGEDAPYTSLHVGRGESGTLKARAGHPFVIPMRWVQDGRGGWRSPFVPGNLRSLKNLFRGNAVNTLDPGTLYYKERGGTPKAAFKLRNTIKFRQRVDLDRLVNLRTGRILRGIEDKLDGYDFGFLTERVYSR